MPTNMTFELGQRLSTSDVPLQLYTGVAASDDADGAVTVDLLGVEIDLPCLSPVRTGDTVWILLQGFSKAIVIGVANRTGVWEDYTPSLWASGTELGYGSSGSVSGRYCRLGDLVVVHARVTFSGTGISGGTGQWSMGLPVSAAQIVATGFGGLIGSGYIRDATDGQFHSVHADVDGLLYSDDNATEAVSNGNPITIGGSDVVKMLLLYEAA